MTWPPECRLRPPSPSPFWFSPVCHDDVSVLQHAHKCSILRPRCVSTSGIGDARSELPGAPDPESHRAGVMQQAHPMQVVHLVRHGRTAWNVQRRAMGWLDEGMEPVARRDAEAVADALAGEDVAAIVSSPLRRALQTAGPLANRVGIEPRLDDRVGELRVGPVGGAHRGRDRRTMARGVAPMAERAAHPGAGRVARRWRELNARVAAVLDELRL